MSNRKARIIGTGSYYPSHIVTNHDFAKILDTNDEWIVQRTGIKQRLFSEKNTAEMGYLSALEAIKDAGIDKNDIDLIILATFTPDHFTPSSANTVSKYLELDQDIPAFDLNAACSGFIYGLKTAQAFIESGAYNNILLIGSENISKHLDFTERSVSILFGDGAGAVILSNSDCGIIDSFIASKPDIDSVLLLPTSIDIQTPFTNTEYNQVSKLTMKGQDVFKFATKVMVASIKKILDDNNLSINDIKYIVPHQANIRIINYAAKVLKTDESKFITNLDRVGNTSSASIGLALDELNKSGKIEKHDKIIFVAFGSGLSYGATLIEW